MLTGDNEGCLSFCACGEHMWRRYPVNSDGRAACRKKQCARSSECLAAAGYLEQWEHCVTRLQVRPVGVRIALVANDVTRYHDYASGSHRGASRTNYPPKWHLAIGMLCRFK